MSVRDSLLDIIRPFIPDTWGLSGYTDEPDVLQQPLVMVNLTTIRPGLTFGTFEADVTLYVLVPTYDDVERNEDAVLDALVPVLDALFRANSVQQADATNGIFPPAFPCWQINLTLNNVQFTDDDDPATEE